MSTGCSEGRAVAFEARVVQVFSARWAVGAKICCRCATHRAPCGGGILASSASEEEEERAAYFCTLLCDRSGPRVFSASLCCRRRRRLFDPRTTGSTASKRSGDWEFHCKRSAFPFWWGIWFGPHDEGASSKRAHFVGLATLGETRNMHVAGPGDECVGRIPKGPMVRDWERIGPLGQPCGFCEASRRRARPAGGPCCDCCGLAQRLAAQIARSGQSRPWMW